MKREDIKLHLQLMPLYAILFATMVAVVVCVGILFQLAWTEGGYYGKAGAVIFGASLLCAGVAKLLPDK